jgi:ribulose kinase
MTKPQIEGLLTHLHKKFAGSDTSPQQEELLRELQSQLVDWNGPKSTGRDPTVTAEMLAEQLDTEHPQLSAVVRELIATLSRIGI